MHACPSSETGSRNCLTATLHALLWHITYTTRLEGKRRPRACRLRISTGIFLSRARRGKWKINGSAPPVTLPVHSISHFLSLSRLLHRLACRRILIMVLSISFGNYVRHDGRQGGGLGCILATRRQTKRSTGMRSVSFDPRATIITRPIKKLCKCWYTPMPRVPGPLQWPWQNVQVATTTESFIILLWISS